MTNKERMSVEDIFKKACEKYKIDFEKSYDYVRLAVEQGLIRVLRSGNTLLIYKIISPGHIEAHIFTADGMNGVANALRDFDGALRKAGFKSAETTINDHSLLKLFDRAGIKYMVEQATDESGAEIPEYKVTFGV